MKITSRLVHSIKIRPWRAFAIVACAGAILILVLCWRVIVLLVLILVNPPQEYSKLNRRGDAVILKLGVDTYPEKIKITLRRAHAWFSETLLTARSDDYSIDAQWRDDNRLEVEVDFGRHGRHSAPVSRVGPIRVVYHWGGPGAAAPAPGFDPFSTCPPPYPGAYFPDCPATR